MNKPVTIVVLAKFKEIFTNYFYESAEKLAPSFPRVLVRDGDEIEFPSGSKAEWTMLPGHVPFQMAGNGNLGLSAVSPESDVLYCGDDVKFLEPDTVERLQEIAYQYADIGILSPRIIGRGSPTQVNPTSTVQFVKPLEMWFPCIYLKREVLDKVGLLDERFNEFGSDDLDFCIRVVLAGYKLAVTNKVAVQHGASPEGGPTTFCKKIGVEGWMNQQQQALEKLREKYGVDHNTLGAFLQTGDCNLLVKQKVEVIPLPKDRQPTADEVRAFLKTRHLHIATPAYGGWLGVNYVNSLNELVNLCRNSGVNHSISFMYNESLITRARNKMVNEFLVKFPSGTDFVFIDADIGFNPRDIITMMMMDEDVVGAPCVRKNLRLDRIVEAVKKNGRDYTMDELQTLTGEYVVNFPPTGAPPDFNLGKLIEVQDVGTGIMRVRRETFQKFAEFFPDRWYLPMMGETDCNRQPMYMFFQAGLDPDSGNYNPGGYPDYIPEDYAFCRDCRKAGMRIWLCPWMITTHMGTHMYRGDLQAVAAVGGALR